MSAKELLYLRCIEGPIKSVSLLNQTVLTRIKDSCAESRARHAKRLIEQVRDRGRPFPHLLGTPLRVPLETA